MESQQPAENSAAWDIEKTNPDLVSTLKEALRTVTDPEIGLSIVELGLIRNVIMKPETVHIVMILTTPFCPYGPMLLESARQKAEEALARPATIEFSPDAWDFSMMEEGSMPDWGIY